jgi:hypothetical protein
MSEKQPWMAVQAPMDGVSLATGFAESKEAVSRER